MPLHTFRARAGAALALCLYGLSLLPGRAATLEVSPLLIDNPAEARTALIRIRNAAGRPVAAQIRLFRWSQADGQDQLTPTNVVVASPPITVLSPEQDYTVRVVRVTDRPVQAEESYRLIVDELPDQTRRHIGSVTMLLRQSIPVFFTPDEAPIPKVAWTARFEGRTILLSASNQGGRRLRVAHLVLKSGGATTTVAEGLAGYVLAGSSMTWRVPWTKGAGRDVQVTAQSDRGKVDVRIAVSP